MELVSNRLILKEISMNDLYNIHKLHSLEEVDKYNTLGIPNNIQETKAIVESFIREKKSLERKLFFWKIELLLTNEFIGIAGINLSLDKFKLGEIYYKILPVHWSNGYATEVAKTLIKCGFEIFRLHKVEAGVATENIASIKVLEKAGMKKEGLRRKILPIRGEWKDNFHFAIVEDDPLIY